MIASNTLVKSLIIFTFFCLSINANTQEQVRSVWFSAADSGIYAGSLDIKKGKITSLRQVAEGINSNYIVQHPSLAILYSVSTDKTGSTLISYHIAADGSLKEQSRLAGRPKGAAHLNINHHGSLLAVAYYGAGQAGVYSVNTDGSIKEAVLEHKLTGSSVHSRRQNKPYGHWVGFSADDKFLLVNDLGTDNIWVYKTNSKKQKADFDHTESVAKGLGPRSSAFHPSKPWFYVSNELASSVSYYQFEAKKAELKHVETKASASENKTETWTSVSDIRIHPSGKFLYLVNRNFDQVSVFSIDQNDGKLSPVEREPIRGAHSRNMAITQEGDWALVAAVQTGSVAIFKVDQASGELQYQPGKIYRVPDVRAIVVDGYAN